MIKKYILILLLSASTTFIKAQADQKLVQFTGVVVTGDSLQPVPFATVMVRGKSSGTVSDFYGFYSFVARKGDTIDFACLGFRTADFVIPDTLTQDKYSLIQVLIGDTINLPSIMVTPWPTIESFKQAFVDLKVNDNDLSRANRNLDIETLQELSQFVAPDGSLNFKYAVEQQQSRLYNSNMYPGYSIMNPIAWAKFIDAWKKGAFKKKKK